MKYKCIKKCFYNDRQWIPGETLESSDKPCKWFVASKAYKKPVVVEDEEAKTFAELHKKEAKAVLDSGKKIEAKKETKSKTGNVDEDVLG